MGNLGKLRQTTAGEIYCPKSHPLTKIKQVIIKKLKGILVKLFKKLRIKLILLLLFYQKINIVLVSHVSNI
jgi:hypothetical protein